MATMQKVRADRGALLLTVRGAAWAGVFLGFARAYAPLLCSPRKF
jgi:hypothetical protein